MSKTGGRGPTDLKGTLGTLIRTTINQVGAVSDVARRSALAQKQRLDGALLERKRRDALADLGELLYQLVQAGEIDIGEVPELAEGVADVEELEQRIIEAEQAGEPSAGRLSSTGRADWSRSPRTSEASGGRVWRPNLDDIAESGPKEPAPPTAARPAPRHAEPKARAAPAAPPSTEEPAEVAEPAGSGGIVFLDDDPEPDDLAEYMNEDDVPSRRD